MDQVSQIREKVDIASLIQEYIPLKKSGRNFKALCPFHNEKTPSFVISPERQIWRCFGCQKGGDCFTFLMEYENMEFIEALRSLAKKTGIELEQSAFQKGVSSQKEKIYRVNKLAAEFYHYVLTKHNAGKKALAYLLAKRKITLPLIEAFKLGYAPSIGNALSKYLIEKKGYKKEDLISSGLSLPKGGVSDFFLNRIIFPLFDHRGNIVGFSARILETLGSFFGPKYINTKDTLAYHKGDLFFGLNVAKDEIKKKGKAIIVEGEFDVIVCFSHGIKNVAALKGTAFTEHQATLISRFAQRVNLCLDQDAAGQDAIKRSVSALEKRGVTTTVTIIPGGKDPDESLKKDPISFKKALGDDTNAYDFFLAKNLSTFDKKTAEGKKRITDELLPLFANIDNEIVKEHFLRKLSSELDTSYESITRQIEKTTKKESASLGMVGWQTKKRGREELLEEYLLSLIVQHKDPKNASLQAAEILANVSFKIPAYQKILHNIISYVQEHTIFENKQFLQILPVELTKTFDTCFLFPLPKFSSIEKQIEEIKKVAKEIKELYLRSQIKIISELIKTAEKNSEEEKLQTLQRQFKDLVSLLGKS